MTEPEPMAQTPEQRKLKIAQARKAHHDAQTKARKRLDAYVSDATKAGLKTIKGRFQDVRNEGQAIDRAVELALQVLADQANSATDTK